MNRYRTDNMYRIYTRSTKSFSERVFVDITDDPSPIIHTPIETKIKPLVFTNTFTLSESDLSIQEWTRFLEEDYKLA